MSFNALDLVRDGDDKPLELAHCIHLPCVVDWNNNGLLDILVGAEDGYVTYLENIGSSLDNTPRFENMGRVEGASPNVHASVLPSPAAFDFNGNGLPDLVVGNCSGELLFYENLGPAHKPNLAQEVKLSAGGKEILINAGLIGSIQGPSEKMFGYTCPAVKDWTGDGLPDVLMSDVLGRHILFQNDGGAYPPQFKNPQSLCYEGKPLITVWRVKPAVDDWVGNGQLHYICLDGDGCLSDYERESDLQLKNKRYLRWDDDIVIRFTEDVGGGRGRVKLCFCDWFGSGRYDLIVGTHARASVSSRADGAPRSTTGQAGIFLLENIGSNKDPIFATAKAFAYKGEVISMGMHVASPEAVDWTGSGKLGLIVGVEDGSIVWLEREGLSLIQI